MKDKCRTKTKRKENKINREKKKRIHKNGGKGKQINKQTDILGIKPPSIINSL